MEVLIFSSCIWVYCLPLQLVGLRGLTLREPRCISGEGVGGGGGDKGGMISTGMVEDIFAFNPQNLPG